MFLECLSFQNRGSSKISWTMRSFRHLNEFEFTFRLKSKFEGGWFIFALQYHAVFSASNFEYLGDILYGQSKSERLMASICAKSFFLQNKWDQCYVTGVHGLNRQSLSVNLDVNHLHQLFQWVDNLPKHWALFQSCFKHLAAKILFD